STMLMPRALGPSAPPTPTRIADRMPRSRTVLSWFNDMTSVPLLVKTGSKHRQIDKLAPTHSSSRWERDRDGLAQLPPPALLLDRGPRGGRLEGEQGAPARPAHGQRADQGAGERPRREAVRAPGPLPGADRRGAAGLPLRGRDLQSRPRAAGHAQGPSGR